MSPAQSMELSVVRKLAHCAVRLVSFEDQLTRKAEQVFFCACQVADGSLLAATDVDLGVAHFLDPPG
jgi:hypothetical protein